MTSSLEKSICTRGTGDKENVSDHELDRVVKEIIQEDKDALKRLADK